MLRVFLMDPHGSPRLVNSQPAPANETTAINGWLSVFSIISQANADTELRVRFKAEDGRQMTAFIIPKGSMIDIGVEGKDISLYMYARDIVPDIIGRI